MSESAIEKANPAANIIVLHVVPFLRGGGAETFVRELIPRLVHRGIDARVLCAYGASQLTPAEEGGIWAGRVYSQERVGVPRLRYMSQLRRCIREVGPTIVHTHAHVGAAWGRTAAVLERVPIIIHTEHISKETLPIAQRLAHKFLNPKTSVTIAFSDRTAAIARKREKIRELRIIPNGIPLQPVPTSLQRHMARDVLNLGDAVVIGVIGNLYPHKKPELALESFGLIPAGARQNVCLAFFGEGPLRESLTARARTLGVGNATRFFGFRRDLQSLLPGLDLVLSTSSREMMPMSLLEAMNAALPIISVPHAGALDLVVSGETGIVVQSWSARDLANALQFATGKPDWRCEAGVAAYARLKKYFDIEMVADEYAALYNGLVHRRRNA